jgi:hypothetical protein
VGHSVSGHAGIRGRISVMPAMMGSRKSGCLCPDCSGPRISDRASENRGWRDLEKRAWGDDIERSGFADAVRRSCGCPGECGEQCGI